MAIDSTTFISEKAFVTRSAKMRTEIKTHIST